MSHDAISDEVCIAAADLILRAAGSGMRYYDRGYGSWNAIVDATRGVLLAQRDHNIEVAREEISRVGDKIEASSTAFSRTPN